MSEDLITNHFENDDLKKIIKRNILLVKLVLIIGGLIQVFYSISAFFQIANPIPDDPSIYRKVEPYLVLIFIFLYFYSWIIYLKGQKAMKSYIDDLNLSSLKESNIYFGKAIIITLISNILSLLNIFFKIPF